MLLLTREEFNKQVFERDLNTCVACGNHAVDAHHILDRKLFEDGGYYLNNGVSLCAKCHVDAECGNYTPQELRDLVGITEIIVPSGYDKNLDYDKWGNVSKYFKYPRTYHFPWSQGLQNDDKMMENPNQFVGKNVVVTIKMDGENTTMYPDYFHARSLDGRSHPSRNYVKGIHGSIKHQIPDGYRICGENIYAEHAITYKHLRSYFQVFSVWDNFNRCMDWNETKEFCNNLGLTYVPVIYEGIWNEELVRKVGRYYLKTGYNDDPVEGYVVRLRNHFHYDDFANSTGKCVRKGHVGKEDIHWMSQWNESMVNKLDRR